jgi:sugar O-acyltransferase (sialic acid O-acetyltransferase NeuD family)
MTERLIILGTGGNAYDVLDTVDAINRVSSAWNVVGFLADRSPPGSEYLGLPVLGALGDAAEQHDCWFVSAIWNDRVYRTLHDVLATTRLPERRFATLVHPGAAVSSRTRIGCNVIIHHGVTIAGNVTIADHVWLGPRSVIGHDTAIATCTTVAPGVVVGGAVSIERNCYVGSGALVRPHVRLGARALVGMGAVVVTDVAPDTTVVGNPATPLSGSRAASPT